MFQQHIHVFRAIAIILVVWTHVASSLSWNKNPDLGRLITEFGNEASIYFIFVTGYLFQFLSTRYDYRKYLSQKSKVVLVPYLLMSTPALIIFSFYVNRENMWPWFYDLSGLQKMFIFIVTGKHLAPYWFIPMIAIFYLFAPAFIWIDRHWRKGYLLIIPLLLLAMYVGRNGHLGPINKAIYMLPVYMLGMAFSRYRDRAEFLISKYWALLAIGFVVAYWGSISELVEPPHYQLVMKTCGAMLLVLILLKTYKRIGDHLNYLSDVSFGVYFVHSYIITASKIAIAAIVTKQLAIKQADGLIEGSITVFLIYLLLVIIISMGVIKLLQILLGARSKYLVGV